MNPQRITAFVLTIFLMAAACGGPANENDDVGGSGHRKSGKLLLDRLAEKGDQDLFDHTYVATLDNGAAMFFVADAGTAAVGYLCNPASGSQWFTGTRIDDKFVLKSSNGGMFEGEVEEDRLTLTSTGASPSYLTLAAASDARIFREPVRTRPPSGLVASKGSIKGTVSATSSETATPSTATTGRAASSTATPNPGSPTDNFLGVLARGDAGALHVTIFTNPSVVESTNQPVQGILAALSKLSLRQLQENKASFEGMLQRHSVGRATGREAVETRDSDRRDEAGQAILDFLAMLSDINPVVGIVTVILTAALNDLLLSVPDWLTGILQEALAVASSTTTTATPTTATRGTAQISVPSVRVEALRR